MTTYNINLRSYLTADIIDVGFGEAAKNDQIVKDAAARLGEMKMLKVLAGGQLLLINGAASMPVAVLLGHSVSHLYGAIGVFDPKLQGYVISISHNPNYPVGKVIDAASVEKE